MAFLTGCHFPRSWLVLLTEIEFINLHLNNDRAVTKSSTNGAAERDEIQWLMLFLLVWNKAPTGQQEQRQSSSRNIFHTSFQNNNYPKVGTCTRQFRAVQTPVWFESRNPTDFCGPWFWLMKGKCLQGFLLWKLALKRRSHLCRQLMGTRGAGWRLRPRGTHCSFCLGDRVPHIFSQYRQ